MQLLNLTAKLDDLYELLRLDGINGTEYFERAGLRCRKQDGEHGLSDVPEESEADGTFLDLREVGADRQSYVHAVTATTVSSSTYDKPESLVSEQDVSKETLRSDGEASNSQKIAENPAGHVNRLEF